MSATARARNPWFVPVGDAVTALQAWVQGELGQSLGSDFVVVAKCQHCDDVVIALGDEGWALVDMTTALVEEDSVSSRVRRLSTALEVREAMQEHAE